METTDIFKCLAHITRLKSLLLLLDLGELCVCDLSLALKEDQPKVSRHLAELKKCALVSDQRRGKWVYYQVHPQLQDWVLSILQTCLINNSSLIESERLQLQSRADNCC
jgi:ArsR family transcriptional regulator